MSDALFGEDVARPAPGRVAAAFRRVVKLAQDAGTLVPEDEALIEGAAVLAETLDTAHRIGGMKGGYLAVGALPPFQRALHALRLPVELGAVTPPAPAAKPVDTTSDLPDSLRDLFGRPE